MFENVDIFVAIAAIVAVAALWVVVPFAVFGVKRRLDAILDGRQTQTEALVSEMRRTNELLYALPEVPAEQRAASTAAVPGWRSPAYGADDL